MKSISDRGRVFALLALASVATTFACGSDTDGDLIAHPPGGGSYAGPSTGGTSGDGSNAGSSSSGAGSTKSSSGSSTSSGTSASSSGVTDAGTSATSTLDASDPQSLFEALLPSFESSCGPCHVSGSDNAPAYLGGTDPYTTIKQYSGIVVSTPSASILVTKGQHEGPALADPLRTSVLEWLAAEAPTAVAAPVTTSAFAVQTGTNQIDLSSLVPGASLTFTAAVTVGSELELGSITLVAPAASGVQVVYPIVYIVPTSGPQIVDDDLSNVAQIIAAGTSATLGPGVLELQGWATGDELRIAFKTLSASP